MKTRYRLGDNFYVAPAFASDTITKKQLQELLLDTHGTVLAKGRFWTIKHEHLGVGVYKITLVQEDETKGGPDHTFSLSLEASDRNLDAPGGEA